MQSWVAFSFALTRHWSHSTSASDRPTSGTSVISNRYQYVTIGFRDPATEGTSMTSQSPYSENGKSFRLLTHRLREFGS
jgi:hypothetical protein